MANNVTLPATGTGDAAPKVATVQRADGSHVQVVGLGFNPVGAHGQYIAGGVDLAQTIPIPAGASQCWLQPLLQNIRVTLDGTAPLSTKGFQVVKGDWVLIPVGPATVIKVISETPGASLEYQFGV